MTTTADSSTSSVVLPAELLDMLREAVLGHADEAARGAVTTRLVREMHEALTWFHSDPSDRELASFQRLVEEAEAHQARLTQAHGSNWPEPDPQGGRR